MLAHIVTDQVDPLTIVNLHRESAGTLDKARCAKIFPPSISSLFFFLFAIKSLFYVYFFKLALLQVVAKNF